MMRRRADTVAAARATILCRTAALVIAVVAAVGLAAAGASARAAHAVPGAQNVPGAVVLGPGTEAAKCPVEVPAADARRVTCGILTVPERREAGADPERTIRLPFAVISSRTRPAAPDPLVFPTSGGPGGGSLSALWYWLDHADWAGARDIILLEQRGDGFAEPSLDCPELDPEHFIVDGHRLSGSADADRYTKQLTACHDRLVDAGIDLSAYTSAASAADLGALRAGLGYDQWNLYGVSYGARLALTTMRDHPEGLRSVVLDGPYPPNINRYETEGPGFETAVDALLRACAADADCGARYPDLEDQLLDVLDRAADAPRHATVKGDDGEPVELSIPDTSLTLGLFQALYDADAARILPYIIDRLSVGDDGALLPLAQQNLDFEGWYAEGLDLSIECAEEVPFNDGALIAASLRTPLLEHLTPPTRADQCAIWGVAPLAPTENAAVVSDIPALITVGEYDPVMPFVNAEAAAAGLSHHFLYEFPAMGHGAVWQNWVDGCAASIASQFLTDPIAEPDASCIDKMAPTDFLTTADIQPTTAIYRLDSDVIQGRTPVQLAILGATVLILGATLVYGVVYALLRRGRPQEPAPPGTVLAASSAAALNLAYAGGLLLVLRSAEPLLLGFGIPSGVWPLLLLPFAALALTVLLVVLLVIAWRWDDGAIGHRIALTISAVGSLGFAVWLLSRGLLFL